MESYVVVDVNEREGGRRYTLLAISLEGKATKQVHITNWRDEPLENFVKEAEFALLLSQGESYNLITPESTISIGSNIERRHGKGVENYEAYVSGYRNIIIDQRGFDDIREFYRDHDRSGRSLAWGNVEEFVDRNIREVVKAINRNPHLFTSGSSCSGLAEDHEGLPTIPHITISVDEDKSEEFVENLLLSGLFKVCNLYSLPGEVRLYITIPWDMLNSFLREEWKKTPTGEVLERVSTPEYEGLVKYAWSVLTQIAREFPEK